MVFLLLFCILCSVLTSKSEAIVFSWKRMEIPPQVRVELQWRSLRFESEIDMDLSVGVMSAMIALDRS